MRGSRRSASKVLTVLGCLYCLRHLWQPQPGPGSNLPTFAWKLPWPSRGGPHHSASVHELEHVHKEEHEESIFEEFVEEVVLCPWLLCAEITVVVMLNACFESVEHWVRHSLDHAGDYVGLKIMDVLFKEFSGLGFIGMFLFLMTQSHVTQDVLGKQVFGDSLDEMEVGDPIAESFETVHMMIFLLMAVLLFQAMALLRVTKTVVEMWGRYERARAWGLRQDSLESLFCNWAQEFFLSVSSPVHSLSSRSLSLSLSRPLFLCLSLRRLLALSLSLSPSLYVYTKLICII